LDIEESFFCLPRDDAKIHQACSPPESSSVNDPRHIQPGLRGRVRHLRGEKELRHPTLEEVWERE